MVQSILWMGMTTGEMEILLVDRLIWTEPIRAHINIEKVGNDGRGEQIN